MAYSSFIELPSNKILLRWSIRFDSVIFQAKYSAKIKLPFAELWPLRLVLKSSFGE